MADEKKTGKGARADQSPLGMPDFSELMSQMQLPGIDFEQLMRDGQKNIEALQEANLAVTEGWQAVAQKQMEIFQKTMQQWQESMSPGETGTPTEAMEKQSQLARDAFDQALSNMQEIAKIASESQGKAFEIMRERFDENMKHLFQPTPGQKSD